MKKQIGKSFGFLRTTALGGVFFLLPLAVVAVLMGYLYGVVSVVYVPLQEWIPVSTPAGFGLLFCIALAVVVLACFVSGLIARRAIGRKFSKTVEKQLMTVLPKYAIYKDLLADNIGGGENMPSLDPIRVRFDESYRLGFESDRLSNGLVVAYLPGSPDTWNGRVVMVPEDRVEPIDVPFSEFLGIFERLGRDSAALLQSLDAPENSPVS